MAGSRYFSRREIITWGLACGAFSYGVAYFFSTLNSMGGSPSRFVTNFDLIEGTILGLPVALVLVSRLSIYSSEARFPSARTPTAS